MISRDLEAGSPVCGLLPSCRKPFRGTCLRGSERQFYCSHECAEKGAKLGLTHVEPLRTRK